ncbi:4-hydroxybutyrate CoA-transferase [Arthrobacter sp. UCD-GKA]|uniref:acetyl-CoA hydrolase/transferase family protein n=1 Tax=Arthrobacter sp. UCD-GKA TaxID=1913576 RepID=UPI0008DD0CA2|nr:acetyl-CoA hydrolase/transferase C-terminal domain-containing protein [Arthrobacter sp. UCD-GKA]OIH85226.1 4-hydroxybutyrate CoA-transferase [Arthrobacter sp. UCD-GKA]
MIDFSRHLSRGDGIWWGQGPAEPESLVNALLDQADSIGDLTAFCGLTLNPRLGVDVPESLTVQSYGGLGELRRLSQRGRLEVIPCHYSALPRLFAEGRLPNDVGLLQVSEPNAAGEVSLGIGVEYIADALKHTRTLIAEINPRMPAVSGAPRLPLSAFAEVVHVDRPIRTTSNRTPDAVDRSIAGRVAGIIQDGDTIQIGVGTLPSAVLALLGGHSNLGLHSGMVTDGVAELITQGVLTGSRKEIDTGLAITGAAMGSEPFYNQLDTLPVEFRPASYTHHPATLAQLRSLVSINSALEVDLFGQVGSEHTGTVHLGAIGGQADFSRAAALTGAQSIIALRSENRGESTIRPTLRGGLVSTVRADVGVIVTEHGAAVLTGCTMEERTRKLIEIAAPQHRDELRRSLGKQGVAA